MEDGIASHSLEGAPTYIPTAGISAPCACSVRTSTCESDIADTTPRRPRQRNECIGDAISTTMVVRRCEDLYKIIQISKPRLSYIIGSERASAAVCALRSELSHYHISPRSHVLCRPILSHHVHVMGNAHPRVHRVPTHEIPMPRLPMRTSCPELGVHVDQIRSDQSTSSRIGAAWLRIGFTSSSAIV